MLLGRKVRGPASRRMETFSLMTFTRCERTHPPSRDCFSISVIFVVGKRRERWKAEERPERPPPRTAMLFDCMMNRVAGRRRHCASAAGVLTAYSGVLKLARSSRESFAPAQRHCVAIGIVYL